MSPRVQRAIALIVAATAATLTAITIASTPGPSSIVMDYYDGNTVTGLWNLAQGFAMNDDFFASTFGPSTPGALNLIAGTTHGATTASGAENGTIIGDPQPLGDDCAASGSNS